METSNEAGRRFAERAIRRKQVFLILSAAGVAIGLGLAAWYGYRRWSDPAYPIGLRFVLVILILLNARQNLRQYRYALAFESLLCNNPSPPAVEDENGRDRKETLV